jgi:hypothetical protein
MGFGKLWMGVWFIRKAIYVSAYFIVDPFRKQTPGKGWLIHEEREELLLT